MQHNGPIPFALALGVVHLPVTTPTHQIVAAQVLGKVLFDDIEITNAQPLQLYRRTADRIEAATRIATGQHLDIQA